MNRQLRIEQRGVKLWLGVWVLLRTVVVAAEPPLSEKGYYEKQIGRAHV